MACFHWKEEPGDVRPPGQLSTLILGAWQVASSELAQEHIIWASSQVLHERVVPH